MDGCGVRRRSRLAVAAVLGLVGSLLAVGAAPGGAVAGEADNEAVYSACVGAALEPAGLVDVEGSFAEDAVNCVAHYGITRGRTETMYDPGAPVLRWQMALFLSRAASPAGVVLPANPEVGFTDLEGVFEGARTAVAQMAQLGVMRGRSSTSFRPDASVSRASMAEMLDAFLGEAEKGSGLGLGALGGSVDGLSDVSPDDEVFTDIGNVTRGQFAAVRRMFELGVAKGTADGRFNPGALVTRAQMAVFITRMLAHTVARPQGVTVQAASEEATTGESVELAVSVRDSGLMAMPDAVVDVFSATDPDDAFGEDGRCSDEVSAVGGSRVCEITVGDSSTGPSGDLELSADNLASSSTIWAWTGDVGDVYDSDDTESSSVLITVNKPGVKLRVADDLVEGATAAKFGQRVVFTLQVVDEDGMPAAVEDVSVRVAMAETGVDAGADPAAESTTSSTNTYKTDASGKIELTFRQTDPRPGSGDTGDSARLDLDVTPLGDPALELEDKTNLKMAGVEGAEAANAAMVWRDSSPTPTSLMLSQDISYGEASKAGSGASHVVKATLTDQYGNPVSRQRINFTSDDPDGIGAAAASEGAPTALVFDTSSGQIRKLTGSARWSRTTNRQGVAALSYNRKSDAPGIETILAVYEVVRGAADGSDDRPADDPDDNIEAERIYHYWAVEPQNGASAEGRLLEADTEANRLVFAGGNTVSVVGYDSNDQFTTDSGPALLDDFEEFLEDGAAHVSVAGYQTGAAKVSGFTAGPEWPRLDGSAVPGGLDTAGEGWHAYDFAVDNGVIAVGAPFEPVDHDNDPATPARDEAGAVYIYESITDSSPVRLISDDPVAGGRFGNDVDISGNTIAVGEPGRHPWRPISARVDVGKLHVVVKGSDGWPTVPTHTWDDGLHNLGGAVAVSADEKTVGAVARRDWAGANHAKTWTRSGRFWNNGASARVASAPAQPGTIGWPNSIAIDGDGDTLVVGGPVHGAQPNIRSGRAYVFKPPSGAGNWVFKQTLTPASVGRDQRFGASVGIDDAGATVVTGGPFRHSERKPGALYVFTTTDDWDTAEDRVTLTLARPQNSDVFGSYVDIASDGSAVAAAAHYRQEGDWRGAVFVFAEPASGWADAAESSEEYVGPEPNKKFGFRVSFDRTAGDLYSAQSYTPVPNPEGRNFAPIYMIDR